MHHIAIATPKALWIVRRTANNTHVEQHLHEQSPECVAIDPADPARLACGTLGQGLWRSQDGGRTWSPAGEGIADPEITAVAFAAAPQASQSVLYAGTEPSRSYRSDDLGETWRELEAMRALPSASSWSFPPRPETHHVRWIEPDPVEPGKAYVAIEAGALLRAIDGGETWLDRVPDGPYDTHTAATHPQAPGLIYSAAGDGFFESRDGGETWSHPMHGLRQHYLVGVAVDPGDPETVVVSASPGPYLAYNPGRAEANLYRKVGSAAFEHLSQGLPEAQGTIASRLASHPSAPGMLYAANNHGLFYSQDGGLQWETIEIDWPPRAFAQGIAALAVFSD